MAENIYFPFSLHPPFPLLPPHLPYSFLFSSFFSPSLLPPFLSLQLKQHTRKISSSSPVNCDISHCNCCFVTNSVKATLTMAEQVERTWIETDTVDFICLLNFCKYKKQLQCHF